MMEEVGNLFTVPFRPKNAHITLGLRVICTVLRLPDLFKTKPRKHNSSENFKLILPNLRFGFIILLGLLPVIITLVLSMLT